VSVQAEPQLEKTVKKLAQSTVDFQSIIGNRGQFGRFAPLSSACSILYKSFFRHFSGRIFKFLDKRFNFLDKLVAGWANGSRGAGRSIAGGQWSSFHQQIHLLDWTAVEAASQITVTRGDDMIERARWMRALTALVVVIGMIAMASQLTLDQRVDAQAGRKAGDKKKKNPGATGDPEQDRQEQERQEEKKVDKSQAPVAINIDTNIVNVEAVVYNKKTGGILQGLKKEHFEIYEDGIRQEIENFASPEAPVTMVLLLEYSKLVDLLGMSLCAPSSSQRTSSRSSPSISGQRRSSISPMTRGD
jgi:hypothetical protein